MLIQSVVSIPKEWNFPEANEDCWMKSEDNISFVISDGASESFDSRFWAKVLCETFVNIVKRNQRNKFFREINIKKLIVGAREKFNLTYNQKTLTWSQEASFKRGSFATILGVIDHVSHLEIMAIGDSVAIWISGRVLKTLKIHQHYNFNARPFLLSTLEKEDDNLFSNLQINCNSEKIKKSNFDGGDLFLLTDALAETIIRTEKTQGFDEAIKILKKNNSDLRAWVDYQKNSGLLKKDDYTLAWIKIYG